MEIRPKVKFFQLREGSYRLGDGYFEKSIRGVFVRGPEFPANGKSSFSQNTPPVITSQSLPVS